MLNRGDAIERFCPRCLTVMRVYSVIGLTLLGLILAAVIATIIWVKWYA